MHRLLSSVAVLALAVLTITPVHGEPVRFIVDGADGREFRGKLHLPGKETRPGPVVIMMPGTDGVDQRQEFYRSHLLSAGIGTLVVDIKTGVFTGLRDRPKAGYFTPVGYEAMRLLRKRPDVDGERIGVMGWSFGGTVSLRLAHHRYRQRWLGGGEKGFAAFVGIYGGCTRSPRVRLPDVPILILIGTADTYTDPARCEIFQDLHRNVTVVFFEGAHHGFDKQGINRQRGSRIMRWDRKAAEKSREHVVEFFKKALLSASR